MERPNGTVSHVEIDGHFVFSQLRTVTDHHGGDTSDWAVCEIGHQIDEVTGFTDDSASSSVGILCPVIRRDMAGVDGYLHTERTFPMSKGLFDALCVWAESAVKSNHHDLLWCCERVLDDLLKFLFVEREWFLDKDVLAC